MYHLSFWFKKYLPVLTLAFILASCSSSHTYKQPITDRGTYYTDSSWPAKSQNERVSFLIMHYTAGDYPASFKTLTQGAVSAHYLVSEQPQNSAGKPVILQLVPEEKRAWHAGVSSWHGRVNINDSSLGIEIINPGYTESLLQRKTWYPYKEKQIAAVTALARDIINRYHIKPENILGHSDVAPLRKSDPGKLFPWKKLYSMGIGAWPDETTVSKYLAGRTACANGNVLEIQKNLSLYGYDKTPQTGELDEATRKTISAFQMHFRPTDISGNADAETEAIAKALVEKYRSAP